MYNNNIVLEKSKRFAIRIVNLYKYLTSEKKEFVLSKQVLRSGTSIGANIKECINAESKQDFVHKLTLSLKEADETEYWLELLHETDYITTHQFENIIADCKEIIRLLISIIKSTKGKTN